MRRLRRFFANPEARWQQTQFVTKKPGIARLFFFNTLMQSEIRPYCLVPGARF